MDPDSIQEMVFESAPSLTPKQLEMLNNKRDRAMRLRLAKRKKNEVLEKLWKRLGWKRLGWKPC